MALLCCDVDDLYFFEFENNLVLLRSFVCFTFLHIYSDSLYSFVYFWARCENVHQYESMNKFGRSEDLFIGVWLVEMGYRAWEAVGGGWGEGGGRTASLCLTYQCVCVTACV